MILLTGTQRDRLLANGRQRDVDHIPVVKFFNPFGAGVWLATELDQGGDIMFGLADIGYPELGSWSLEELRRVRLPFGMGIERDLLFTGDFPISVWAGSRQHPCGGASPLPRRCGIHLHIRRYRKPGFLISGCRLCGLASRSSEEEGGALLRDGLEVEREAPGRPSRRNHHGQSCQEEARRPDDRLFTGARHSVQPDQAVGQQCSRD